MPITLLPVFEADADPHNRDLLTDEETYARLETPDTLVVKFGYLKWIAEFRYSGDIKPGCGTKMVARTHRGTELVEMLTTTCDNSGCGKSITRKEMLEYISNSGGADFPFHTNGRVLRVATIEDLNRMSELGGRKREWIREVKAAVAEQSVEMNVVEIEPILGEEVLTIYFMAEDRVDFRELVRHLAGLFKTRIEMRQVGARDEARLVADYEWCGQHCCCKNFLKVLKPVSMRAAKMQKATLDPLKISGRCGRLMCCLRYEDQTYRDLKKNLPHRKSRVGTRYGPGIVRDSKILVQLVLINLEHNNKEVAVAVEELLDPDECPQPAKMSEEELRQFEVKLMREDSGEEDDPLRGLEVEEVEQRTDDSKRKRRSGRRRGKSSKRTQQDSYREQSKQSEGKTGEQPDGDRESKEGSEEKSGSSRSKRRRRRRKPKPPQAGGESKPSTADGADAEKPAENSPKGKRKRGRGRRRRGKGGSGGGDRKPGGGDNGGEGGGGSGPPSE